MPFIHRWVAVMPDVHLGLGATIGSVIPTKGAIIPAAVGVVGGATRAHPVCRVALEILGTRSGASACCACQCCSTHSCCSR